MDGAPPPEEDFSLLSIEERLAHKNWKARVSAYETLVKTFQVTASDNDPAFRPFLSNPDSLKKIVTDSNAVAQERGLECVVAFVKNAGENAARTRDVVVPALVDKCLGSTRAGTKNQAVELALQYIEVDNGGAGVVADIIPGLGAKQPKAVAGCVAVLKEAVRLFGTQVVLPQPILKILPKIFGHTDKTVRAEGTLLTQALYQYIGPALDSFLADLKPVQVKELKESFEALEGEGRGRGTLKPERLTRAHARELEAAGEADEGESEGEPFEEAPVDPRAFAEEVDVMPKFPNDYQISLSSSKWKDRKEALDAILDVLKASMRIQSAPPLGDLARQWAVMIQKDANIMCVMGAAGCIEALAKGLSNHFGRAKDVVPPMLERLKERKANVTDTIGVALDAVFATANLSDILGDIQAALGNKNPQVKEGTLKFLGRCLSTTPTPISPSDLKPLSEQLAGLMEDSFEGARNEAATCLGTLMKMVGERPLGAVMEGLADVRKAKVKEAFEKATVKAKAGGPAKPPPKAAVPPAKGPAGKAKPPLRVTPAQEELYEVAEDKPVRKPPARLTAKKTPATSAPTTAAPPAATAPAVKKLPPAAPAGKGKAPPSAAPGQLDAFKYKYSSEDADGLVVDLIPSNIQTDFADPNWKIRLAALEEMTTWVEGEVESLESELVVRFLAKKGWSDKNFQVSAKLYGILDILAKQCPTFGRSSAALCIPHLSEKLGDIKLKKPAGEALMSFAERTSLQFVLGHAYEPLSKQKAPKVIADATTWIESALTEFGIAGLALRGLIEFLKTALKNSNAAVRSSATKTLVTVKLFAGPSVKDLLEDLNPQLMNTILAEFDKVEGQSPPEPTRTSADLASVVASDSGVGKKGGAGGADPLDDLFPRVELDGLLKGTSILADSKSDAWKTKKEALEMFQAILDQGPNKRLKPSMGEVSQVLKARVVDSNKAVQALALDIVGRIAMGMGKPFDKYTRFFTLPVVSVLSDAKAPPRNAAVATLTAMATACESLDTMMSDLVKGMETQNPMQRASLLAWLAMWYKDHEGTASSDLASFTGPILASLDDRSGDVRKSAQSMLPYLVVGAGYDYVMRQTDSLKAASKKSAVPLIQAAHAAAPAPAAASASKGSAKTAAAKPPKEVPQANPPPEEVSDRAPSRTGPAAPARKKLPIGLIKRPVESRAESPQEAAAPARLAKPGTNGIKRVASTAAPRPTPAQSPSTTTGMLFHTISGDAKRARLAKDAQKWIVESGTTRKDLADLLQHQMEPHASRELVNLLFSHDHNAVNDHVAGLTMMTDFYASADTDDAKAICVANVDLPLKYVSMKGHEPQSNLISKNLDCVDAILELLQTAEHQLSEPEAMTFVPTLVYKLGDAREPVRVRVQAIVQMLPKVYAYNRLFHILLEYGLKSKVAKTRQGSLDEMAGLIKRYGKSVCEPSKAMPVVASMISDKDPAVRKAALGVLSEEYVLLGETIWSVVGTLSSKDKTQLEERLRRVAGPSAGAERSESPAPRAQPNRLPIEHARPASPSARTRIGGIARPGGLPGPSRLGRPASPAPAKPPSALPVNATRSSSPVRTTSRPGIPAPSGIGRLPSTGAGPSRLAAPRARAGSQLAQPSSSMPHDSYERRPAAAPVAQELVVENSIQTTDDITIVISSILSNDPSRSVDALKRIQSVLAEGPDAESTSSAYRELAEHTEGLIETITVQIGHVFDQAQDIVIPENFRLAKHLIQTLNAFCDHVFLAESLTVDVLTALLQELTLRLLETDDSQDNQVKDLSRFINMIILRLFSTARRMSIFRSLFALLLQLVKPFPAQGTPPDSKEAKIAELVLKCIWKLARNMPQDLEKRALDPVELFPAIEHFLQSVPPNEWRARATNKVPCGDMPLRTIKVIIQHVVGHYGDDVYDLLSSSFEDPSATIVYPYVYRILNSSTRIGADAPPANGARDDATSPAPDHRPISPPRTASTASFDHRRSASPARNSQASSSANGHGLHGSSPTPAATSETDPDEQLMTIINHISSEKTGAMHKEGITELHQFLKAYPHKQARVDKLLESTGTAFRKYITRALATRAAEDQERDAAVSHTLLRLEGASPVRTPVSPKPSRASLDVPLSPRSPTRATPELGAEDRLSRLHNIFQYRPTSNPAAGS